MKSDFNSLIKQIKTDLSSAEELMKNGNLDHAFKLSEIIDENIQKLMLTAEHNPNMQGLQTNFAKFRRNLNNQMVKVLKSSSNQNQLKTDIL